MTTIHKKKRSTNFNSRYLRLFGMILIIGAIVLVGFNRIGVDTPNILSLSADVAEDNIDISGEWLGIVTEDYNNNVRYEYHLYLEQRGDEVRGRMIVISTNTTMDISALSTIHGQLNGDEFTYREVSVEQLNNIPTDHWCHISASLEFETVDNMDTLVGDWNGIETPGVSGCLPTEGRITLMRQP